MWFKKGIWIGFFYQKTGSPSVQANHQAHHFDLFQV